MLRHFAHPRLRHRASMVVWESGRMKKSDYRKFIIRGEAMPIVRKIRRPSARRFRQHAGSGRAPLSSSAKRRKPLPSLILVDGGMANSMPQPKLWKKLAIINQPLASIAKKRRDSYVLGREDEPIILERHSPVLAFDPANSRRNASLSRLPSTGSAFQPRLRTSAHGNPGCGRETARTPAALYGSVARLKQLTVSETGRELTAFRAPEHIYAALAHPITTAQPATDLN